jgi:hypothetical protein
MNINELDELLEQAIKLEDAKFTLKQFQDNFLYYGDLFNFYRYLNATLKDERLNTALKNDTVRITALALMFFVKKQLELQPNVDPIRFIY